MYKSRLQELCHRRRWAPPEYADRRDGPDHAPRFHATVTVDGAEFHSPDAAARSCKEAHNLAAMAAFEHLSALQPPAPAPLPAPPAAAAGLAPESQSQVSYKSQLQMYAQKRSKELPLYNCIRHGPPHASLFKATVTLDGQTFESPSYCHTVKEAETAAAHVALMSLPPEVDQPAQVSSGFYKCLLQELIQKEGLSLPAYITAADGSSHVPSFKSTVEIEGERFQGEPAKTKKQAESNAAKIALDHFNKRMENRLSSCSLDTSHMQKENHHLFAGQPTTIKLKETNIPIMQVPMVKSRENDLGAGNRGSSFITSSNPLPDGDKTKSLDEHVDTINNLRADALAPLQKPSTEMKKKDSADRTLSVGDSSASLNIATASSTGCDNCSLLSNRVAVYPRRPDLALPEGATLLPFSDDKWVAVSLDFSNDEGGISV